MQYALYSADENGKMRAHGVIEGRDELEIHHKIEIASDEILRDYPETKTIHSEPSFAY